MALGRTVAGEIARRSAPVPTPLRRGATAAVVAGGALSLAGVAATIPLQLDVLPADPSVVAAAAVLPIDAPTPAEATSSAADGPTSTLLPVPADAAARDTERLDTARLVKAVQLAERETTAPAPDPAAPDAADTDAEAADGKPSEDTKATRTATPEPTKASGSADCDLDTSQLGAVKPHVRSAATFLGCRFGEPTVLGVAGRAGSSDHPSGKALDFMVEKATGNAIAACALRNQEALGVSYVIWRQRINFGSGWKPMEDRGGPTANHEDHVHISFESKAGGRPSAC